MLKHLNLEDFDAVAFDMEGTLADTIPVHHTARLAAFAQHGYGHITPAQHALGSTYGSSPEDIIGGILHAAGEIDADTPFAEHPTVQAVVQTRKTLFTTSAAAGFEAMPGAIAFVEMLASRYADRLALVTSSPGEFVGPFLERYGLAGFFRPELVISHDTVVAEGLQGKPHPDPYALAMRRLGTKKLLVFEDTSPGVAAAKRAGATVVGLGFDEHSARQFQSGGLEYPPDVFVRDYTEASEVLGLA